MDWVEGVRQEAGASALAAGLTFRPLRDTRAWAATFGPDHTWRAGLTPERERAALDAWHAGAVGE